MLAIAARRLPAVALAALLLAACGGAAAPTPTKAPAATTPTATPGAAVLSTATPTAAASTPTRAAAAPTAVAQPTKPSGSVTIVIADGGAQHLDPHQSLGGNERAILDPMFQGMVGFDLDGSLEGRLATQWGASESATVWEFKLRQGVKFHNGDSVTAEDVKFSFDKAVNETSGATLRRRVDSVTVLDPMTVRIKLKLPFSIFETDGAPLDIVPKGHIEKVGAAAFANAPVGIGPFKFVTRRLDEFASFEAFDGYWRRPAFVRSVNIRIVPESSVRLAMLKTGEADVMSGVTPTHRQEILNTPGLRVISAPNTAMMWMWAFDASKRAGEMNVINPDSPWSNKLVRQAANYAVDRDALVKGLYQGDAAPMVTTVKPGSFGFNPKLKPYPYDPKKARELLAQAGFPNGFTTDLYTIVHSAMVFTEETSVAVAKMWADVGIKSNIQKIDVGTYYARVRERKLPGIGVVVNGSFWPSAWSTLDSYLAARSWPSPMFDQSIDADLDKVAAESDRAKREAVLQDLVAREYEMASNVFLLYGNTTYGVNSRVRDWPQTVGYGYLSRVELLQLVR